jgi:hypothetical protein
MCPWTKDQEIDRDQPSWNPKDHQWIDFSPNKYVGWCFFPHVYFFAFWIPVWFPTAEGMISTTKHGDELNMRQVGSHYPHAFQNTFGSQLAILMGMIFQQTREKCTLLGCATQM